MGSATLAGGLTVQWICLSLTWKCPSTKVSTAWGLSWSHQCTSVESTANLFDGWWETWFVFVILKYILLPSHHIYVQDGKVATSPHLHGEINVQVVKGSHNLLGLWARWRKCQHNRTSREAYGLSGRMVHLKVLMTSVLMINMNTSFQQTLGIWLSSSIILENYEKHKSHTSLFLWTSVRKHKGSYVTMAWHLL